MDGGFAGLSVVAVKCVSIDEHDSEIAGYNLRLVHGTALHIYIRKRISMHDEAALHAWFGCKGSSGLRCCLMCMNVINGSSTRSISGNTVYHTCTDPTKFVLHTYSTLRGVVDRLETDKTTLSKGQFIDLERKLGWTFANARLLRDPCLQVRVDPSSQAYFDYQHVFLVDGIVNHHFGRMMYDLRRSAFTYKVCYDYVQL